MAASPADTDIDKLDADGLRGLLLRVLEENAALRAEVVALREENRRLSSTLRITPRSREHLPCG